MWPCFFFLWGVPLASSFVLYVLVVLLLIIVVYPSALLYCFCLALFSVFIVFSLVVKLQLATIMAILVSVVYLGGMMIIIGYVCAVTPNMLYTIRSSRSLALFSVSVFGVMIFALFSVSAPHSLQAWPSVSYLFSFLGWGVFIFLVFFILLVLYSASSFTQVNSPFRSF